MDVNQPISRKATRPNIVYIVLDDVGFSDFGCYGSEIDTPNIDRLAEDGVRYNKFNVTPLCSPTRASLLTGRNHHSIGMGLISNADLGEEYPNKRGRINSNAATTAEVLKENGYSTFAVGKWHLAPLHHLNPAGPFDYWPLNKGFERYYGFLDGSTDQFAPDLMYDNHRINMPKGPGYHLSEDLVDHAKQFITDQVSVAPEKPFFLYLAFGAMHAPHQAPKTYIDMYKGSYAKGWDKVREERLVRQRQLGIIPEDTELSPHNPGVEPWDSLTEDEKTVFARLQEVYSGFLTHTDEQIGRFVEFLDTIGKMENTLVVLLSDNGASQEGGFKGSINHTAYFNGIEETTQDLLARLDEMGGPNADCNYPRGWAQVSNTPFKYYKQNTFSGGIRVPLVMHWPKGIQNKGSVCSEFYHVIDVTPTIFDILDIEAPDTYKGVAQMPLHGMSMAETFKDFPVRSQRSVQYFETFGHRAIWRDGWMAVTYHTKGVPFEEDKWELYNLNEDFAQVNDLAEQCEEKLRELQDLWWTEAKKYDVLPIDDRTFELFTIVNPESVASRNHFTYYPGMSHLGDAAAPAINNKSYTITVSVDRPDSSCDGVLVAHGNHNSGYTFYIKDNLLVYEYNYVGQVYRAVSTIEVPIGPSTLCFEFKKSKPHAGIGLISINDEIIGEVDMPKTLPFRLSHEGLDVGRDTLSPVSTNYDGEFQFTGEIEKVVFELQNN
ncbi:arylsulfatase [Sporosarcina obsidiansis]|uniref:arylsulfatase n=1 Tax=Sporosarcina obsidiansis TaxID=2660748 RepID=UPI00129A4675|nr:arylsulfatase [Sporosarcina obsidiansis]